MRTTIRLVLISSVVLAAGCAPAPNVDNRSEVESAVRALDERWSATASKHDLDGTVAFYAADAVLLPPNAPIAPDRASIRRNWADLLVPNSEVSWKVSKVEAARSGDMAYLYGTYTLSLPDPQGGPAVHDVGKLVEIWKKQPDGTWKCAVDTFNSDLPVSPPAPAR